MTCHSERLSRLCSDVRTQPRPTSGGSNPTSTQPHPNLAPATAGVCPTYQPFLTPHVRVRTRACTWRMTYLHIQVVIDRENTGEIANPTSTQPLRVWERAIRSGWAAGNASPSMRATQCDGSSPASVNCGPQSREIPPPGQKFVWLTWGAELTGWGIGKSAGSDAHIGGEIWGQRLRSHAVAIDGLTAMHSTASCGSRADPGRALGCNVCVRPAWPRACSSMQRLQRRCAEDGRWCP
jgi:hypothetical protein